MYKQASQKFSGGCYLLVRRKEESVLFLGSCFVVHEEGYLLTSCHLLEGDREGLMAVRPPNPEAFSALSMEDVPAVPLEVIKTDAIHNTALLRFAGKILIETPDHLLGSSDSVLLGSAVLCFGFPFGHRDMFNLAVQSSIISSKVKLRKQSELFLIDTTLHDGMAGGPMVNLEDGRVVGILTGRFSPEDEGGDFVRGERPDFDTNFSYAVSIDYGKALMEEAGISPV